jgi:pyrimidine-specific ribonucleoside hydrolase
MRQTYVIDTDMAIDDWMALLYLLLTPHVLVRTITVAATGEAHAGPGVQNALRLLALTGTTGIPVAAGRTTPLQGRHTFPWIIRLAMDLRLGLVLPRPLEPAARQSAVTLLTQAIQASLDSVTVIALGPLTNLAEAILTTPSLAKRIAMIYFMGGALSVRGNLGELNPHIDNPFAEWNTFIDPYAADVVFQSGIPITLVPLDVTNQVPLTADFYQRCAACRTTPAGQFLYRLLRRVQLLLRGRAFYFWDPLTAVVATYPQLARFEQHRLGVIRESRSECGRIVERSDGMPIRVCTEVDRAAFEHLFLTTINERSYS